MLSLEQLNSIPFSTSKEIVWVERRKITGTTLRKIEGREIEMEEFNRNKFRNGTYPRESKSGKREVEGKRKISEIGEWSM